MAGSQNAAGESRKSFSNVEFDNKFLAGLQDLQALESQLTTSAEVFESSYIRAESKKAASGVLETTQEFAVKALISITDRLAVLARELDKLVSRQVGEMTTLDVRMKSLKQRASGCQLHIQQEALRQQRPPKPVTHYQKRIVMPDPEVDAALLVAKVGPVLIRETFDTNAAQLLQGLSYIPVPAGNRERASPRKGFLSGSQMPGLSSSYDAGRSQGSPHIYPSGPSAFESPTYHSMSGLGSGALSRSPLSTSALGSSWKQETPPLTPLRRGSLAGDSPSSARSGSSRRFFSGPIKVTSNQTGRDVTPASSVEPIAEEKPKARRWWNVLLRRGKSMGVTSSNTSSQKM